MPSPILLRTPVPPPAGAPAGSADLYYDASTLGYAPAAAVTTWAPDEGPTSLDATATRHTMTAGSIRAAMRHGDPAVLGGHPTVDFARTDAEIKTGDLLSPFQTEQNGFAALAAIRLEAHQSEAGLIEIRGSTSPGLRRIQLKLNYQRKLTVRLTGASFGDYLEATSTLNVSVGEEAVVGVRVQDNGSTSTVYISKNGTELSYVVNFDLAKLETPYRRVYLGQAGSSTYPGQKYKVAALAVWGNSCSGTTDRNRFLTARNHMKSTYIDA